PVIVDATFLRQVDRARFIRLANERNIFVRILDVTAPEVVRAQRIKRRQQEGRDASEATVSVMKQQADLDDPFTAEEIPLVIPIDSTDHESLQAALGQLARLQASH
ncbi:MAG: AAA family ATPase, partial [Nitrospira sp.]|nr:AAA family ATPase [Nitrospira sp.]